MARIGIDAHAIGGKLTGNETYISNLMEKLLALNTSHDFVLFFTVKKAYEAWKDRFANTRTILISPSQPLFRIPFILPYLANRHRLDVLHVQYAGPPFITVPLVTTIHDIAYEHYPESFTRKEVLQFRFTIPRTARKAKRIFTVSEYSKRDLVEFYGLPSEKIVVTYDGVGEAFHPLDKGIGSNVLAKYRIDGQYIISVGNLQPRKNLVRLIRAYGDLRQSHPEIRHKLVIVGKKAWKYDAILDFARDSIWSNDIIMTGYVDTEDLPVLYARAALLVYPSIFEGFGLPPLEAMACGTPVIVADRTAMPEIVGSAGAQVDPFDVVAIREAIISLLQNEERTEVLGKAGKKRALMFTWDACAKKTLQTYEEVLSETA